MLSLTSTSLTLLGLKSTVRSCLLRLRNTVGAISSAAALWRHSKATGHGSAWWCSNFRALSRRSAGITLRTTALPKRCGSKRPRRRSSSWTGSESAEGTAMFEPLLPLNFLRRAARLFPHKTAVIDEARRYTYRDLEARVHRLSNALRHLGVAQGDKVAVLSPNSHRVLEAFFAVPQLGAVLAPLNYRLTTPEFAYILEHSETRVVLVDWQYAYQLAPLVDTLKG